MTDNEIIKALKDEIRRANYIESYYIDCVDIGVFQNVLALINRQKAEIEALQMDNKQLQSDVINANQNWDHIKVLWECEKEKVESAKQKVICACKMLTTAKSEEIKEFADRLKEGIQENHYYTSTEDMGNRKRYVHITNIKDFSQYIDNLVKEMTEVNENEGL